MSSPFYTIQASDVGRRFVKWRGKVWSMSTVLGYIQPQDVGKRVYLVDGILQAENNEQMNRRIEREEAKLPRS